MPNLFENDYPHSRSNDLLAPGSYVVELVTLKPGKSREFDGKPPKPTITFCFREQKTQKPINRTVSATRDPRGRLFAFVTQLAGAEQPTPEELADGSLFTQFIEKFIGKKFRANVGVATNGRFNDILSVIPMDSLKGGK